MGAIPDDCVTAACPLSSPFTTSMTDDHAPSAVSAGVNECLKLGSGGGGANVRVWVESTRPRPVDLYHSLRASNSARSRFASADDAGL